MGTRLAVLAALVLAAVPMRAAAQDGPTVTSQVVTSFDGTPLVTHLFVPAGASDAAPAPLVLRTHGWGGTGQSDVSGFLADLLDAGYIVLTWDQRGFGCSGADVELDHPAMEGRDVSALIDWAVANAPVAVDAGGDPLVGMTGGSYAGGVQTASAAFDDRIDVLAPEVSWHDLREVLYSGQVVEQGWALLLYAAGAALGGGLGLSPDCPTFPQAGGLAPGLTAAFVEGVTTNTLGAGSLGFLAERSLASYGSAAPVAVPTLVVQGSTDTLFDLTQGQRIVDHVRSHGAPAKFLVFCGGHVSCPPEYGDADDGDHYDAAILAWLARWLDGDASVDTGPAVEYRTNEGVWRALPELGGTGVLAGSGSGSVVSVPVVELPDVSALVGTVADYRGGVPQLPVVAAVPNIAGDPRGFAVELGAAAGGPVDLAGEPSVTVRVQGIGTEVILMAKLVDREAGRVVNLHEGAVRVPLLGGEATATIPMSAVVYTLAEGHHLDLHVSTASLMHANARLPAQATVAVEASVPVRTWVPGAVAAPVAPPAAPEAPAVTLAGAGAGGAGSSLPATGGGAAVLAAAVAVAAALATRERRPP